MTLLFIELHGANKEYMEHLPSANKLGKLSVLRSDTSFGSIEAIWSGVAPIDSNCWHLYYYDGGIDLNPRLLRYLRGHYFLTKKRGFRFKLSRTKHFFQTSDIFNGISYLYLEQRILKTHNKFKILPKKNDEQLFDELIYYGKSKNFGFIFLEIKTLDRMGHKYGPNSKHIIEQLYILNHCFEKLLNEFSTNRIIIVAGYGMDPVKRKVNISEYTSKGDIYFIDDLYIRFWKVHQKTINKLNRLPYGDFVQGPNDRKFGQYYYKANNGIAFVPNHFTNDVNGVHRPEGFLVSNVEVKPRYIQDVYGIIKDCLS